MKISKTVLAGITLATALQSPATSAEESGWYARLHGGVSNLDNTGGRFTVDDAGMPASIDTDSGSFMGLGVGYQFDNGWRSEVSWEYRRNDSAATVGEAGFPEGDYASSIVYLNGIYQFRAVGAWTPYLGAGLAWAQEIDIDIEQGGVEQSYSADGDVGYQAFAGIRWSPSALWGVTGELRYGGLSGIDFEPESGAPGTFTDLDYTHTSVQLGLEYAF